MARFTRYVPAEEKDAPPRVYQVDVSLEENDSLGKFVRVAPVDSSGESVANYKVDDITVRLCSPVGMLYPANSLHLF